MVVVAVLDRAHSRLGRCFAWILFYLRVFFFFSLSVVFLFVRANVSAPVLCVLHCIPHSYDSDGHGTVVMDRNA